MHHSRVLYNISNYTNKGIICFDKIRIKTIQTNVSTEIKELTKVIFLDRANFLNKEFGYEFILQIMWGKVYRVKLLETARMVELI